MSANEREGEHVANCVAVHDRSKICRDWLVCMRVHRNRTHSWSEKFVSGSCLSMVDDADGHLLRANAPALDIVGRLAESPEPLVDDVCGLDGRSVQNTLKQIPG